MNCYSVGKELSLRKQIFIALAGQHAISWDPGSFYQYTYQGKAAVTGTDSRLLDQERIEITADIHVRAVNANRLIFQVL